jgi:hypothetical protein
MMLDGYDVDVDVSMGKRPSVTAHTLTQMSMLWQPQLLPTHIDSVAVYWYHDDDEDDALSSGETTYSLAVFASCCSHTFLLEVSTNVTSLSQRQMFCHHGSTTHSLGVTG